MVMFRRILCPVDFSEYSRHALDHAVAISHWYGGTVTALHVLPQIPLADPMLATGAVYTPEDVDGMRRDLDKFVQDESGLAPIDAKVSEGPIVSAIVHEAMALSADLIVLGTHGLSGFQHLMLGSVTERMLRKAPCPVLTVPPRTPDAGPVAFRKILCPVDFSPASMKALSYAASLSRESHGQLTMIHVVEPFNLYEPLLVGGGALGDYTQAAVAATGARLHEIAPAGVDPREVVAVGKPYRAILDHANEGKSDLIVIGVHGGIADRLGFFGSTTNHIVREASCPVLSLRA